MVGIDLGRLVHQHRVGHVGQAATGRLLRVVVGKRTGVRTGGGKLCAQCTTVAFGYGIAGNWKVEKRKSFLVFSLLACVCVDGFMFYGHNNYVIEERLHKQAMYTYCRFCRS